jgi:hypothetical protein
MSTGMLFANALLAEAAYADLKNINNDNEYNAALVDRGFSPTQAVEFVDEWATVSST